MPVERPTFSESWYRVTELRPRLRSTVQVNRQHFRGRMWHVIQDPGSNQFFRLNEPAYRFVALLDGRRTVGEAWRIAVEQLGDDAPTQGEVIQLLGQLYVSNLLMAELPPDAETMFNRYKKRVRREVQGYLMNLLFVRLPLLDPDRFLNAWVWLFGRVFTIAGLVLWFLVIGVGLYSLAGHEKELMDASNNIFDPSNLLWLYVSIVVVKVIHEFGHAFACKRFGVITGTGGEVHVMGVMFLVFTPMPYVDASSSWAFRSKWQRAVVNAAGMIVELAVAAFAAVVWTYTNSGSLAHVIAYNVMFIASVSTVLFNGNPLLRYDAYYILSDLTEIPNLWQRSKEYLYYIVKKYAWNVKHARSPAHTPGEAAWMAVYAIASFIYRVFIYTVILLFLYDRLPKELAVVALVFGVASLVAWLCVPTVKFLHYLATNGELQRVRGRAALSSAVAVGIIVGVVGFIPVPDRTRVEGVVEPVRLAVIYAGEDGFVERFAESGAEALHGPIALVECSNRDLTAKRDGLVATRAKLEAKRRDAWTKEVAAAQALTNQIAAVDCQIVQLNHQVDSLTVRLVDAKETWVSWDIERLKGTYLHRGDRVGLTASLDNVLIRAVAGQDVAVADADNAVEIRVMGRPEALFSGRITKRLRVGDDVLPSAALGYAAGGSIATAKDDKQGLRAAEHLFELRIVPDPETARTLWSGQRVIVRLSMPPKPIGLQLWHSLLQVIQKRFPF